MAASTQQVASDIKRLSTALDQLNKASGGAYQQFTAFSNVMSELSGQRVRDVAGRFTDARRSIDEFARTLKVAQEAGKLNARQLEELIRITERLAKAEQLRFKGGGRFAGRDSTLGKEPAVNELVGTRAFMKDLPGGERALATVTNRLKSMKMELGDISDVSEDAARGTVRWTAQMKTVGGVTRRATVVTNKWGQELKSTQ